MTLAEFLRMRRDDLDRFAAWWVLWHDDGDACQTSRPGEPAWAEEFGAFLEQDADSTRDPDDGEDEEG